MTGLRNDVMSLFRILFNVVVEVLEGNEGLDFRNDNSAAEGLLHERGYRHRIHTADTEITAKFRIGSYLRLLKIQRVDQESIRL